MSPYRLALDRTWDGLAARAKAYRPLIVSFVIAALSSAGGAIAMMSLQPASGLLLLVPAYGIFLWRDSRILARWRRHLGEAWAEGAIDFSAFRHAVSANPALPGGIVQAMLATLPQAGDLPAEQAVEAGTRQAVACALSARDDCRTTALACRAAAHGIIVVAIIASLVLWAWQPLPALSLVLVPAITCACHRRRRMARAIQAVRALRGRTDFDDGRYREILTSLDWNGLSPRDQERLAMPGR